MASLIATLGIPFLAKVLGGALGQIDNPVAKAAASALNDVQGALEKGQISPEQLSEANRHAEQMAQTEVEANAKALEQINQTARSEVASNDAYVRRMRPTFGYLMALSWAAQMIGIAYVIIFQTDKAGVVIAAMSSLSAIWAVGLSVLGVYVYKRSEEKQAGAKEVIFWNK